MTDIWNLPNNISSIYIGQKEIQSIIQTSDSTVLYQKPSSHTYLLTAQLSQSTIYTDGSTIISGVLTDNGSAMANETITIYDGATSLGTCTTDSNGAYSKTLSGFNSGNHSIKASHTNADSSTVSLTVNNHSYSLTATLGSSSIYVDGSTTISGQLTIDGSPSPYQTLTLYDGNTVIETFSTDVMGNYSRTLSGLSVGTHTLKVSHSNIDSSNVTLTVNNHTYAVSLVSDKSTVGVGEAVTFTATLTLDGVAVSGETILFYENGTAFDGGTTNANGIVESEYLWNSVGTYGVKAVFGDIESNTVTVTVSSGSTPSSMSISATKDVLSKHHNDTSVLTATVLDSNNNPCSGETVTFKNGSTVLGTDTTDSNGEAEYTYTATGSGNVSINVECMLLSEIYEIEDCFYAHLSQIDTPRNGTTYHKLNNDVITGLPSTYKVEFDMKSSTSPTNGNEQRIYWSPSNLWTNSSQPSEAMFVGYCYSNKLEGGKRLSGRTDVNQSKSVTPQDWCNIRLEKVNNNSAFYIYHNDTYYTWWTLNNAQSYSNWLFGFALWSDTTFSIRNIKIKPL